MRSVGWLQSALLLGATLLVRGSARAADVHTVQPAGVVGWHEMVAHEARAPRLRTAPHVPRRMPAPPPRVIGSDRPRGAAPTAAGPPALEAPDPLAPVVAASFPALPDDGTAIPPDTMGAVGAAHLVTMLNTEVRIHDRAGADLGTVSLGTFWTAGTGLSGNPFDPKLVYDAGSGRWLATVDADGESATSQVWFAMSAGPDPTGTWTFWGFQADGTGGTWADYPALGANATWIAITNDMYTVAPSPSFAGAKMWVIDKASALAGGPLTVTVFPTQFDLGPSEENGFALQPALTFGAEPTLYLADGAYTTSGGQKLLRISRLTGTGAAPTWSVQPGSAFAGSGVFAVTNDFDFAQLGARQLGTAATLDSGDTRMMNAVFRNGRLWCTHTGGWPAGAVERTVVLWYQLDPGAMPSPIVQSGVLNGGPSVHLVYPSIAANAADDVLVGLSRTDAGRHPEAAWTARAAGDPPGTMSPVTTLKAGEDFYAKDFGTGTVRWGDYSATAVDPADDLTFWTIQEYAADDVGPAPDDDRWGTWWGAATVVPATASTTTTLPCEPAQCADADPCTEDACAPGGGCSHAAPSGYSGVTCRLDDMAATLGAAAPEEVSRRVQAKIGKRIARSRTKLGAAEQAQALGRRRGARAKLKVTGRHLDAIARAVEKAKLRGTITSSLGNAVYDDALDAIRIVDALRAGL